MIWLILMRHIFQIVPIKKLQIALTLMITKVMILLEVASSHKTNINAIGITLSIDSSKGERLLLTPKDGSKSAVYLHREININYLTNDNRSAETRDDWYFRIPVDYQIEIPVNSLEEEFPHPFLRKRSIVIYGT